MQCSALSHFHSSSATLTGIGKALLNNFILRALYKLKIPATVPATALLEYFYQEFGTKLNKRSLSNFQSLTARIAEWFTRQTH